LEKYRVTLGTHLFGLPSVSQAGLEPVAAVATVVAAVATVVAAAYQFSQCNMAWRSFLWVVVQGVEVLIVLGVSFLPSVSPVSQ
jgi:hypothetical protein